MRTLLTAAALAIVCAGIAATTAGATTGPAMFATRSPLGVGSNTAAEAGSTGGNFAAHVFVISGSTVVSCADATLHATAPTTNTLRLRPTYSGCVFFLGPDPVAGASIDVNCEWTLTMHHATFNDSTGAMSGSTLDAPCQTTLTVPAIGCTYHLTSFSGAAMIGGQNVSTAGGNDTSASPWGSKLFAAVSSLHYSTTIASGGSCIFPATGTFGYVGNWYLRNVWSTL